MIPTNYSKAINSPDSKRWILAMRKELDFLVENNTFEWQKALKNKNIISSRRFFTIKSKSDEGHEYQIHFVAKGYSQIYDKDYRETFIPTTNIAFIRLLPQIASNPSSLPVPWKVKQRSLEEYEQDKVGKYVPYFQGNTILPIPEITATLEPQILSLAIIDIKSRRLAGLKKDTFEELLHTAGIPAQYFCQ